MIVEILYLTADEYQSKVEALVKGGGEVTRKKIHEMQKVAKVNVLPAVNSEPMKIG